MSQQPRDKTAPDAPDVDAGVRTERVRERVDALGDRLEEPVRAVTQITRKTLALFPIRVWRRFLARNGFILSSGMSYQALFAVFAIIYVAFAVAGLWLGGSPETVQSIVNVINKYIPGLIGEDGIITPAAIESVMDGATSLLGWTGVIALGGFIWTAISWITYSRLAVRSIFGLPKDTRSYVLLKTRDFIAALGFGAVLLTGAVISVVATNAVGFMLDLIGITSNSGWANLVAGVTAYLVVVLIDSIVIALLFLFLSGAALRLGQLWSGSLLAGFALGVLQLGASVLIGGASSNPLLATFTVFIGMLLWFRLTSLVTLVAAAWVQVAVDDRGQSMRLVTPAQLEAERMIAEHDALVLAAKVAIRQAENDLAAAHWWNRVVRGRRVQDARRELDELEASWTPPVTSKRVWYEAPPKP